MEYNKWNKNTTKQKLDYLKGRLEGIDGDNGILVDIKALNKKMRLYMVLLGVLALSIEGIDAIAGIPIYKIIGAIFK